MPRRPALRLTVQSSRVCVLSRPPCLYTEQVFEWKHEKTILDGVGRVLMGVGIKDYCSSLKQETTVLHLKEKCFSKKTVTLLESFETLDSIFCRLDRFTNSPLVMP